MQTGTIFSGIGHAGLILWVLVGDWLFPARPTEEIIATQVSLMTSAEFEALQAAATPNPSEVPAPVRPQARPEEVVEEVVEQPPPPEEPPPPVEEPPPVEAVVPEEPPPPPPSDAVQAEAEQLLPSEATEIQPVAEAEDIVAPDPVQPETEAEVSDTPAPAVAEDPAAETVVEEPVSEATVAEDTGDILQTEANEEQTAETGMMTSIRPRSRPETPAPEPATELASAEAPPDPVDAPAEQPVDDQATDDAIAALLDEAAAEPAEDASADTSADTGGQDLPQGPPLTGGEMGDISSAIARKWNLGAASTDTMSTMIVVRVSFGPDGKPTDFELLESNGPTQTGIDKLYESARRAVNRAYADGGLPLPEGKYDTWRVLDLVFDANGMRLR